jgi:hypothetical protein
VVRRILAGLLLLLALPSILAAGLGLWTTPGAWQQHLALDLLLDLLLWLEHFEPRTSLIQEGLVGTWEVPLLLGITALVIGTARWWERPLPWPVLRLLDLPEMALACLGLVAGGAVVAIGASVDRPLFWAGLVLAWVAARELPDGAEPPEERGGWRAPGNRRRRLTVAVVCAGVAFFGVTSLWEGATWRNPVFRLSDLWIAGPGRSGWLSGGIWLVAGVAAAAALLRRPLQASSTRRGAGTATRLLDGPRWSRGLGVGMVAAVLGLELIGTSGGGRQLAAALSALGLLALAFGAGPLLAARRFPKRHDATVLDPRHLSAVGLPLFGWAGLCLLRGFSVLMWTPVGAPGVEQIGEADCVFSLSLDRASGDVWYTDRCRTAVGRIDAAGDEQTWSLTELGVDHVEELGGPDGQGVLWAASQANVAEANLVLLAVEGALGPRSVPDPSGQRAPTDADRSRASLAAYVPMPSCWVSSWVPLPGGRRVLLGCENRAGAEILDPVARRVVDEVALTSRVETGTFTPAGDRLFGVSLWADPTVRAWSWPEGEELARRVIGPFNWTVTWVPEPPSLWVSRFVEGQVLVLDPENLLVQDRLSLSFGIRAMLHEPVHDLVWAAAAYSGRLWVVEPRAPYRRRAVPVCGQTRDLVSDGQGRVVVSTDCGIFRVDPTAW